MRIGLIAAVLFGVTTAVAQPQPAGSFESAAQDWDVAMTMIEGATDAVHCGRRTQTWAYPLLVTFQKKRQQATLRMMAFPRASRPVMQEHERMARSNRLNTPISPATCVRFEKYPEQLASMDRSRKMAQQLMDMDAEDAAR